MNNVEYKEKMIRWAEVLESGKYQQKQGGWGSLEEGKLCCLNVALVEFTGHEADATKASLSRRAAAEIFGKGWTWCGQFMDMNDDKEMTFPEIAAEIRKMVEGI